MKSADAWASFAAFDGATSLSLSRGAFEAALSPLPLSAAPPALRNALETLGKAKPQAALLRLDGASGRSVWYAWGADPSASRELHAWANGPDSVLVLAPGGEAALSISANSVSSHLLAPPVPGSFFTGCAMIRSEGGTAAIVAAWEEPIDEDSGIIVAPALQ